MRSYDEAISVFNSEKRLLDPKLPMHLCLVHFLFFISEKLPIFLLDPSVLVRSQVLGVECHLAKDYEFPDSAYLSNTKKISIPPYAPSGFFLFSCA